MLKGGRTYNNTLYFRNKVLAEIKCSITQYL